MPHSRRNAILLQALAGILFSAAGLLIKVITVSPLTILGVRGFIAAMVIALWMGRPRFTWSAAQIGGAIALASAQLFFVVATRQTTAANAIFLQYAAPVYVAFFGVWFLGEPARRVDWVTMGAILAGLLLFFGDELTPQGMWGNVNAIISGIAYAWFILFMRKQRYGSTVETVFLGNLLTGLIGLPFLFFEPTPPTLIQWGGLLFLGVLQLGLPFILVSITIKQLTAMEAILIQTLEPVFNPVWVFLVIGETPTPLALLGCGVVLLAVTFRAVIASRERS